MQFLNNLREILIKLLSLKFWDLVDQDPSDSKSNRLQFDIFSWLILSYVEQKNSKMIGNYPATSIGYFSNSTGSFVTNCIEIITVCHDHSVYKSHRLHVFFFFLISSIFVRFSKNAYVSVQKISNFICNWT